MTSLFAQFAASVTILLTRFVTAVRAQWVGCAPTPVQRIYFVNHASHGDFVLAWAVLPPALRAATRPVAGADYWLKGPLRRFIATKVFKAVLIDRTVRKRDEDPITVMEETLAEGASLILFPEGTRNVTDATLLPFKSGIYHLAQRRPDVELVPVWIANLNRVLPKGEIVPIPLLCTVTFGPPLTPDPNEEKTVFLERAREALLALSELTCHNRGLPNGH